MKLTIIIGFYCAAIGIIFYVLFELYPVPVFYVFTAFFLVVALFLLFISTPDSYMHFQAYRRYKSFEKIKDKLTQEYEEKKDDEEPDSRAEDEESQGDADLK